MKTTDLIKQLELCVVAAEEASKGPGQSVDVDRQICMDASSGRALLDALKRQARGDPDEYLPILREALVALDRVPTCPVENPCEDCCMMCVRAARKLHDIVPEEGP